MSAMQPAPKDSPLMKAWEAYKLTEDYANTKKWAVHPEHVDGSLWAAFMQGFLTRPSSSDPRASSDSLGERLRNDGFAEVPNFHANVAVETGSTGVHPGPLSSNNEGPCRTCNGTGGVMGDAPGLVTACNACDGTGKSRSEKSGEGPTPRTDAVNQRCADELNEDGVQIGDHYIYMREHAEQLERERNLLELRLKIQCEDAYRMEKELQSAIAPQGESRWLVERTYAKGHPAERREFWLGIATGDIYGDSFDGGSTGVWTTNALEAARFSSYAIAYRLRLNHFHPEAPVEACEHLFQCGTTENGGASTRSKT